MQDVHTAELRSAGLPIQLMYQRAVQFGPKCLSQCTIMCTTLSVLIPERPLYSDSKRAVLWYRSNVIARLTLSKAAPTVSCKAR